MIRSIGCITGTVAILSALVGVFCTGELRATREGCGFAEALGREDNDLLASALGPAGPLPVSLSAPQSPKEPHAPSLWEAETRRLVEVERRVRARITSNGRGGTSDAWTGDYHAGDGLGWNIGLTITPAGEYLFTLWGCVGLYEVSYGSTERRDGCLHLRPANDDKDRAAPPTIGTALVMVRNGDRRTLVPIGQMDEFCTKADQEYMEGMPPLTAYLVHDGDENRKASTSPTVPAPLQSRCRKAWKSRRH